MKKYRFQATIQAADRGGAYVLFPYDTQKEFATRGRIAVKAVLGGVPYTGSLIKYGHAEHMLPVLKAIREQAGKRTGDAIDIVLWKDEEARRLEVPAAFATLMKKEGVLRFFEGLSYTHRKEYCRWISEAKKEETRAKRLEKAVAMLRGEVKTPG
jgi:hypothetical protein